MRIDSGLKSLMRKGAAGLLPLLLAAGVLTLAPGCSSQVSSLEQIEQIHAVYTGMSGKISRLDDFFVNLQEMDLENALFLESTRQAIEDSAAISRELRDDLETLKSFKYTGELDQLGKDIEEYGAGLEDALAEMDEVTAGFLSLLGALEPTLREEAVITNMAAPQSDAELLERLVAIDNALAITLSSLEQVQVPEILSGYKLFLTEMFSALDRASALLLAAARGEIQIVSLDSNPDADRFNALMGYNGPVLLDIQDQLMVNKLEPYTEKVENDIYSLFLKLGSEDEDKR